MKKVEYSKSWPDAWKYCYEYDRQELYGDWSHPGYVYAYQLRKRRTLELIEHYVPQGGTILDVAAAQGNFSLVLAERGYSVTWNDIREELVDYVKLKYESGALNFAPGNVLEIPFPKTFDCVLITEIIEHVAHPDKFLQNIASFTKPGGVIVMTTPNGGYFLNRLPKFSEYSDPSQFEDRQYGPNSDDHIFLLHADEIYSLAESSDLEVLDLKLGTNTLSNGHCKSRYLLHVLPETLVYAIERLSLCLPLNIQKKVMTNISVALKKNR